MKRNWKNKFTVWFLLLLLGSGCHKAGEHAEHQEVYTCPMHHTVLSDKPGICPVCGMNLVHQTRLGEEVKITDDLARLLPSPNTNIVSSVATQKGEFKTLPVSVVANGVVTYDTRYVYTISTKIEGRLEQTYLKYIFQRVTKGQRVAEIYSPDMITTQRELLFLLENDPDRTELIASAKIKLQRLGASLTQIEALLNRKEPLNNFPVFSPYDGYVISNDQQAPGIQTAPITDNSMPDAQRATTVALPETPSTPTLLKSGSYVSTGQPLFRIVNTTAVRLELVLPASPIRVNDDVVLNLGNNKTEKARVDFVQPFFSAGEEFMKLRVFIKRQDLFIGQFVQATIQLKPVEALWLPQRSILNLGQGNIVFVKERGVFNPRTVMTGARTDEWIAITQGLTSTDEVATDAHYLADSESFIQSKK